MVKFRKSLALLLSLTLVVSFALSGIVLPVSADTTTEPVDLYNGLGSFDDGTCKVLTYDRGTVINDPLGTEGNKVLQIPAAPTDVTDAETGEVTGKKYSYSDYLAMGQFYNAETGKYNKTAEHLKSYTISFDVYGGAMEFFIQAPYLTATSNTVVPAQTAGWYKIPATTEWTTHTFVLYSDGSATKSDWYNWYFSFAKGNASAAHSDDTISYTYLDNITVVETVAESLTLDVNGTSMKPGDELTLTATIAPLYAAHEDIVWSSSAEDVATVVDGVVTAKANGTANITATAGELSATCAVKVDSNLLPDGDISNGKTGTWKGMPAVENGMIKIPSGTAYNTPYYWQGMASLDWEPNQTYLVSYDVKGDSLRFQLANTNGGMSYAAAGQSKDSQGAWMRIYAKVTTNADPAAINSNWCFHFKTYDADGSASDSDIYIDNVRIEKWPDYLKVEDGFEGDVRDGFFWEGITSGGLTSTAGATITTYPDGSDNKVLMVPQATTSSALYFSQQNHAMWNATDLHRYTIRYKGTYTLLNASAYAKMIQTKTTTDADGWKTTTYVVDLVDGNINYGYNIGLRTPTDGPLYIDYMSWEKIDYATGIALDKTSAELAIGGTLQLTATENPTGFYLADSVVWSTSNSSIATVSNGLVTAKSGGEVTITATAGSFTASCVINIAWPVEQFPNGDMENPEDRPHFTDAKDLEWCKDGVGVDGSKALVFTGASKDHAHYFYKTDYKMRPNSLYIFSYVARSEGTGAQLEVNLVSGNCPGVKQYDHGTRNLTSEWTQYYMYLKTGDAPSMNSSYNIFLHPRALGAGSAPIYVDNISLKLLETKDNILPNSDFTFEDENWDGEGKVNVEKDPIDSTNNVLAVYNTWNGSYDITGGMGYLDSYAMYTLTFNSKVDEQWIKDGSSMNFYIGEDGADGTIRRGDLAFYNTDAVKQTTEWQSNTVVIFTNSMTKMNSNTFHFNVTDGTGTGKLYIDNLKLQRVDDGRSVHGTIAGGYKNYVSVDGATWYDYIQDVEPGTVVYVKPAEHGGAYKVLTALTARNADGTVNVLNKDIVNGYTADNFGTGDGRVYQYVMGEKGVRFEATLSSADSTSFKLDTVGTSLRYTEDDTFDGIRFLTRLQLKKGSFDAETGVITVLKDGVEYTVVEMGSVMARSGAYGDELTIETAKWQSVAYTADGDMKLIDYTTSYVDFTVVMTKGANVAQETFEAREYAARGYIVLEDAEGNQVTIYSENTQIDSVDSVQARL